MSTAEAATQTEAPATPAPAEAHANGAAAAPKAPRATRRRRARGEQEQPVQQQPQPQQEPIDLDRCRIELEDHVGFLLRTMRALNACQRQMVEFSRNRQIVEAMQPKLDACDSLVAQLRVLCSTKAKAIPVPVLDSLLGMVSKFDQATQPKPKESQQ